MHFIASPGREKDALNFFFNRSGIAVGYDIGSLRQ
jgi:hypothetical protein